jgi:ribosomal-protein-alanine N-acetyltransferase
VSGALPIATARLVLRRPTDADIDAIFERYASDTEVTRYLGWPTHRSRGDTEAFLAFSDAQWQRDGTGPLLAFARDSGRLLGSTGLALEGPGHATTGYLLARDAWGCGYATEMLAAMVALAASRGCRSLETFCHPDHRASQRVLEKGGFTRNGETARGGAFPNLDGDPGRAWVYTRALAG